MSIVHRVNRKCGLSGLYFIERHLHVARQPFITVITSHYYDLTITLFVCLPARRRSAYGMGLLHASSGSNSSGGNSALGRCDAGIGSCGGVRNVIPA